MIDPAVIRAVPLFAALAPEAVRALAERAVERRWAAGRTLYAAGDPPSGLIVILEGRVRVVRDRADRRHLVHHEGPGGALGEVPVFGGGRYPATAVAAEPVRGLVVSVEALRGAIRRDPETAFVFLRRLADRTRHLVERLDRLASQDVTARLARLLLERQRAAGHGVPFLLGRTQGEVAEELGTVREVLVRSLRRLRDEGAIEAAGRGRYRVGDAAGLEHLADR
jgi:CRP/FNR family transcriptional regulator